MKTLPNDPFPISFRKSKLLYFRGFNYGLTKMYSIDFFFFEFLN